ncbi:MAG: diguanylate cyclase domain-containing protein [Bryobacteraceae bacterium]
MFISLKRYLTGADQELADSLLRMTRLLLEAIRLHAVVGDPADYEKFQKDMGRLLAELEQEFSPQQVLVVAGAAAKTLADYNQRTTRFVRMQTAELHGMLAMLAETVASISAASERTVTRLQNVEKQLERATMLDDIRSLKARLSECLLAVREESQRQREEMARTISQLRSEIQRAQQRQASPAEAKPASPRDGLGRAEAEEALARVLEEGSHAFVAVYVVARAELIRGRFGPNAAEQVVQFFRHHLAAGLLSSDKVFRWGPASFVVIMERRGSLDEVREEAERVASVRLEKTIQVGSRTALLPVTSRCAVIPVFQYPSLRLLLEQIDAAASRAGVAAS